MDKLEHAASKHILILTSCYLIHTPVNVIEPDTIKNCVAIGDLIMKRGWYPIKNKRFKSATLFSLSKDKTWISNIICRGVFDCSIN